jgi:dTDP-4-amino-4,6-dideoxygalactose transaminase
MIPMLDLKPQYASLRAAMDDAILAVLRSGQYLDGPHVAAFEQSLAAYHDVAHAVAVASGSDALYLALRALDVGPGDEVITAPFADAAASQAIALTGARPVFADIDPVTYNLDPAEVERKLTPRTKALLPTHLFGQPADMSALSAIARDHGLALVEDATQAFGATLDGRKVGTFGQVAAFSFAPATPLGAYGDGGACITDDPELAARLAALRNHGAWTPAHQDVVGIRSRFDEIQAAALCVKLPHVDAWNACRRELARRYDDLLQDVRGVMTPEVLSGAVPVYSRYVIRLKDRDGLREGLSVRGVLAEVDFPVPQHLQRVHEGLDYRTGDFPIAERASRETLSLPIFPELALMQQQAVVEALRQAIDDGIPL